MKRLFTIDLQDYDPNWPKYYRPSVRGIIFDKQGNVAMIYSQKFHFYKFPGGGIEGDETYLETLSREVKEETGLTVIPESAKEFGEVLVTLSYSAKENTILVQHNYYYTCEVESEIGDLNLDEGEKELGFIFKFVPIDEAIRVNASFKSDNHGEEIPVQREKRILEMLKRIEL